MARRDKTSPGILHLKKKKKVIFQEINHQPEVKPNFILCFDTFWNAAM